MPTKEREEKQSSTLPETFASKQGRMESAMRKIWVIHEDGVCLASVKLKAILASTIERGFLAKEGDHGAYLFTSVTQAFGEAEDGYTWQVGHYERGLKLGRFASLHASVRKFLDDFTDEAMNMDHGVDKLFDEIEYSGTGVVPEELTALDAKRKSLLAILDNGEAFLAHLTNYLDDDGHLYSTGKVILEEWSFFRYLADWWDKHCLDTKRYGTSAARNRIALVLWNELFPDERARDEEWAKGGFGKLRNI